MTLQSNSLTRGKTDVLSVLLIAASIALFLCGFFFEDRNVRTAAPLALADDSKVDFSRFSVPLDLVRFNVEDFRGSATAVVVEKDRVRLPAPQMLTLSGWLFDESSARDGSKLFVTVDAERAYACAYGTVRPDVSAAFRNERARTSGFRCTIPAATLTRGRHSLRFDLIDDVHGIDARAPQLPEIEIGAH